MELTPPTCIHPDCIVALVPRARMGRRGARPVKYEARAVPTPTLVRRRWSSWTRNS